MARPRVPIGAYGEISFSAGGKSRVRARTRFRDWDGQTRQVQATGSSRAAAEAELKKRLTQRNAFPPVDTTLTPDSPFPALMEYWLADLDLEGRIAPATRYFYERDMRRLVLPAFRGFTLREIGVARCDALLKQLGASSYSSAKRARTVLRQSFALAVRHEVLPRNPSTTSPGSASRSVPRRRSPPPRSMRSGLSSRRGSSRAARAARTRTASSARSSRSCSAPRPGSAKCWRSAAATWT